MIPPFDIFKVESSGPRWMEVAADLERAKARVKNTGDIFARRIHHRQTKRPARKISIQTQTKRILFQIGYDEKGINARAELLRRFGHEVISVTNNEAAKVALSSYHDVELFIVGHTAPEQTRKEMVAWLKTKLSKGQNCGAESIQGPTRRRRLQRYPE